MNFKDELKKSIPPNLTLTEKEKALVRIRIHEPNVRNLSLKPAFISLLFLFIVGVFIVTNIPLAEKEEIASTEVLQPTVVDEASSNRIITDYTKFTILSLSDEQKQRYYEEYTRMIQEANDLKLGLKLELDPIDEFSYWVSLEDFKKRIQGYVDSYVQTEREKVAAASSNLKDAKTNANGETTKRKFIYISGLLKEIEFNAKFETNYSGELNRQLFVGVENISTQLVYQNRGNWEQTSYEATIVDGGKTYRIRIEGIFTYMDVSYEKAFTIEFECDQFGNIT